MIKQDSKIKLLIPAICFLNIFGMLIQYFKWDQWLEILIFIVLTGVCFAPAFVKWFKRSFDPFEPVYSISLATFVYFVLMGVLVIQSESYYMLGISYREEFPKVLLYALLALLSFYAGYYGYSGSTNGKYSQNTISKSDFKYLRLLSWLVFGFFTTLVILWIIVGRIPLSSLWIFGEASYGSWWNEAEGPKIGYLYAAREALIACLLLLIAFRKQSRWPLSVVFLIILIFALYSGTGGRTRVLIMITSVAAFYFIEKHSRPKLWQLAVLGFFIFYVVIGGIGYYRGANRSLGQETYDINKAWDTFEESSNIITATAVTVRWIPEVFGYSWGKNYLNILIMPIPGFLWSGKYDFMSPPTALSSLFLAGAATSLFADFYRNFGPFGIIAGMVIIGFLCRKIYLLYTLKPNDKIYQIKIAILWGFLIHVYGRGSPTLLFFGTIYVFAPVWLVQWFYEVHRKRNQKFSSMFFPVKKVLLKSNRQ